MRQVLWIPGPLPGQNEIIAAAKGARGTGRIYAATKARWTNAIALAARAAKIKPVVQARFTFAWRETTKRRNPDNIAAGKKFIFDGLVVAEVLKNDGWGQVHAWLDSFEVAAKPGVQVIIEDVDAQGFVVGSGRDSLG